MISRIDFRARNTMKIARCDRTLDEELYYLIQRLLAMGPCLRSAQMLREEMEAHQLLPVRFDYRGQKHPRKFKDYDTLFHGLLKDDHLKRLCTLLPSFRSMDQSFELLNVKHSLLGAGKYAISAKKNSGIARLKSDFLYTLKPTVKCLKLPKPKTAHICNLVASVQYTAHGCKQLINSDYLLNRVELHTRIFGHLSSVFCVTFDRSGQYIFTGADDNLIKLWSVTEGRLLFTFRGFSAEITDLTISHENTLLAAGSCDKTIRVLCLRTGSSVAVLQGHTAMITSLQFLPYVYHEDRWLISTGNDCCVCFWKWNVSSNEFITKPIKFAERLRVGGQMVCLSHSPGGRFIVTGGTDYYVRVYVMRNGWPERIIETEGHTDRVGSVQWAHRGLRFITGSRDGMAKIWSFSRQEWKTTCLTMEMRYERGKGMVPVSASDPKNVKLRITMVAWSADDAMIVIAVSDTTLRVWDSANGSFLMFLLGHSDEVFVLEPHPINAEVIMSAGHDGNLILWNIPSGKMIKKHFNEFENNGHGAFFDARFSAEGDRIAAVDSHGHLLIFGAESNQQIRTTVTEQFFHTDYRPLIRDANQYVLDEQTQLAPHLMPPPFLVNSDGDPYPAQIQRRVPGRECCDESFLMPVVLRSGEGGEIREIIDNLPPNFPTEPTSFVDRTTESQIISTASVASNGSRLFSAWATRFLTRPMDRAILDYETRNREMIGLEELKQYEAELAKSPLPTTLPKDEEEGNSRSRRRRWLYRNNSLHNGTTTSVAQTSIAEQNQENGSSRPLNVVNGSAQNEDDASNDDDSQYSDDDDDSGDDDDSASSTSYSSFSCSESGRFPRNERLNESDKSDVEIRRHSSRIKVPSERFADQDKDSDEQESVTLLNIKHAAEKCKKKRAKHKTEKLVDDLIRIDDWDAENQMPGPSTSNANFDRPRRTKTARKEIYIPEDLEERKNMRRSQRVSLPNEPTTLADIPDKFLFPEWMTCCTPKKSPYFPQPKDEVVYFPVGHRLYVEAVERFELYPIYPRQLPWNRHEFQDQEFAVVLSIRFEIVPYRLCCVKLAQINPKNGKKTGLVYAVRYHDMPNVIDFLVLRQYYDQSIKRKWKPGDRFQTAIDDSWWFGTVVKKEPFDARYPSSFFLCLNVLWDNGDEEKLSPWDLEPFDQAIYPTKKTASVPASAEELRRLNAYRRHADDWPSATGDADDEIDRLSRGVDRIAQFAVAEPFAAPVDLAAYPTYCLCVEYPADLSSIRARLNSGFYRRVNSVEFDIRQILRNAKTFNESRSQIVQQAKILSEILLRFLHDTHCNDIGKIYNEVSASESKSKLGGRSDDKQPKRHKHTEISMQKDLSEQIEPAKGWIDECKEILAMIRNAESCQFSSISSYDSEHSSNADDASSVLKLKLTAEKLIKDQYESPMAFSDDLFAWFDSKKVDRTNKRSKVYLSVLRLKGRAQQLLQPIIERWRLKNANRLSNRIYNTRNRKLPFREMVDENDESCFDYHDTRVKRLKRKPSSAVREERRRLVVDRSDDDDNAESAGPSNVMSNDNDNRPARSHPAPVPGRRNRDRPREAPVWPKRLSAAKEPAYYNESSTSSGSDELGTDNRFNNGCFTRLRTVRADTATGFGDGPAAGNGTDPASVFESDSLSPTNQTPHGPTALGRLRDFLKADEPSRKNLHGKTMAKRNGLSDEFSTDFATDNELNLERISLRKVALRKNDDEVKIRERSAALGLSKRRKIEPPDSSAAFGSNFFENRSESKIKGNQVRTRYEGRRTVRYAEQSSDEGVDDVDVMKPDDNADQSSAGTSLSEPLIYLSTSSRGRLCKLRKFT